VHCHPGEVDVVFDQDLTQRWSHQPHQLERVTWPGIRTEYVYPPIPDRRFDWRAVEDGYDIGRPIGEGPTEEAAVEDLKGQL
jgi:hypothetical protein